MLKLLLITILIALSGSQVLAAPMNLSLGPFGSGKIYIPCTFDGTERSCFLDTAGGFSALSFSDFSKKYSSTGVIRYISAAGVPAEADMIIIKEFRACGRLLADAQVARFRSDQAREDTVGIDLLASQRAHFDFRARTLEFGGSAPADRPVNELRVHDKGIFSIPVKLGHDQRTWAFWDTGAGLSAVAESFVTNKPELFDYVMDIPNGQDATGASVALKLYQVRNLFIGTTDMSGLYVVSVNMDGIRKYVGADIELILGFNAISQHNWFIDLEAKSWAVY